MKKALTLYSIAFTALFICQKTNAGLVFSEGFGSLANGTTITTANTGLSYARIGTTATGTTGNFLYATNDQFSGASALMGANGASLTGLGKSGLTAFSSGTLDFSVRSSTTLSSFAFFLGTGATFTGNGTFAGTDLTAGFQFANGQLQTRNSANAWANVGAANSFAANTSYDVSVVFNDTASSIAYGSGSDSVAAGTADVWINGLLFGDDVSIRGATTVTGLRMYTTTSTGPIEVDNINLFDTTPVPEPSTIALATMGGLACLIAIRRKR